MSVVTVKIGGVDVSGLVSVSSVRITDNLGSRNTASFELVGETTDFDVTEGDEVEILKDTTTIFSGSIFSSDEQLMIGTTPQHKIASVSCVDLNELADRFLVAKLYENETLGDIVTDLVSTYLGDESITTTHVETGVTIARAVWSYVPLSRVFDDLAELTGYTWYIDYDRDLHFCSRSSELAPRSFTDADRDFRALVRNETRAGYRNVQYVRAGQDTTDSRTDSFVGDGTRKVFTVGYPVAATPTVTVGGVSKTVGIRGVESGKDWYWSKGEKEISQDDGASALSGAQTLAVTYVGFFPLLLQARDESGIAERAAIDGGSGRFESIEDDASIDDLELAIEKADALLRREGRIKRSVTIETDEHGFRAGQLLTLDLTDEGVSGEYLITAVDAQIVGGVLLRYSVKAVDGEAVGGWEAFFRRLLDATRSYVIRENEVLSLLRRFSEAVSVSDTCTASSDTPESRIGYAIVGFSEVS